MSQSARRQFSGRFRYNGYLRTTQWAYSTRPGQAFLKKLHNLRKAGRLGRLVCGCQSGKLLGLIPYRKNGRYWLMRMSGDGLEHANDCGKHGVDHSADRRPLTASAYARLEKHGEVWLDEPLDLVEVSVVKPPADPAGDNAGVLRPTRSITMLTLANVLFTAARMDGTARRNRRLPDDWSEASRELRAASETLTVSGVPLKERLALPRGNESPRLLRRPFRLSHAAMA